MNFSLWLTLHERDFQAMCILEILKSACTPNPCIRESIQLLADNTDQSTQMGWQVLVFLTYLIRMVKEKCLKHQHIEDI